jgi:hypothetical protein
MSRPRVYPLALVVEHEDDQVLVVRSGLHVGWYFPAMAVAAWICFAVVFEMFGWLVAVLMISPYLLVVTGVLALPGMLTTRFDAATGLMTRRWRGQYVGRREVSWPLAEVARIELVTGARGFQRLEAWRQNGQSLRLMPYAAHWDHPYGADQARIERFLAKARAEAPSQHKTSTL